LLALSGDAVSQDLYINGIRGRSRDGEFHHELARFPVSIGYCIGSELDTISDILTPSFWVRKQKADVAEHPEVFDHVGLLTKSPPARWVASHLVIRHFIGKAAVKQPRLSTASSPLK